SRSKITNRPMFCSCPKAPTPPHSIHARDGSPTSASARDSDSARGYTWHCMATRAAPDSLELQKSFRISPICLAPTFPRLVEFRGGPTLLHGGASWDFSDRFLAE